MSDSNFELEDEDPEVTKKKAKIARTRNLHQYKNLSDEEFQSILTKKALGIEVSAEFEKRIKTKLDLFGEDYDLSDLKINDRETLRALIQSLITLEDYEQYSFKMRSEGISENTMFSLRELNKAMTDIRSDISKLQNDLNITRKIRKSDQDVSVMAYIEKLRGQAKKFAESKMSYVFCPKCNMLLGTFWVLYPENDRNKIALVCERTLADGSKCGEKIIISTKKLLENRGTSDKKITPESML